MAIPVAINRMAAFLAPAGANAEGLAFLSGMIKLAARFRGWSGVPAREAAMVLTRSEQAAIFGTGRRFLWWAGGTLFLVGAVLDLARTLIGGSDEKRSLATRLEIIQSHIVKGGPLLTRAIGVGEQVLFILLDASGETMNDLLAGALSTFDMPGQTTALPSFLQGSGHYVDLATPVADIDEVDSIIEVTPSILLQPGFVPFPVNAETFPGPPMPSWGRRS